jgi:phosphoserine aminotransferase
MRKRNFSAGPSCLPLEVLERVQESVLDFQNSGTGLFETGHRTKVFESCLEETKDSLKKLLGLTSEYEILFTTGGGSLQFSMIPLNLGVDSLDNYYLVSGSWSKAAIKEAQQLSNGKVAGSSEENGFRSVPEVTVDVSNGAYLHFTSNNTIYGTQFQKEPDSKGIPLICDASSDILSRPLDIEKYSMIYGGAQKNLGPAGVTLVILKKEMIKEVESKVPKLLQYKTYLGSNSLYNTPPVSSILVVREMLAWIERQGGVEVMSERNKAKAKLVYDLLDTSSLYLPYADPSSRSLMNATFTLRDTSLESALVSYLEEENCLGLKGHRSVGGFRVSLYNAITLNEVRELVDVLRAFESSV